jgi:hypothetical protein
VGLKTEAKNKIWPPTHDLRSLIEVKLYGKLGQGSCCFTSFNFKSPERDIVLGRSRLWARRALVGKRGKIRLVGVLFELLQAMVSTRDHFSDRTPQKSHVDLLFSFMDVSGLIVGAPRKLDD